MSVKVRFAPSPTGKLHVGNVRAALWNWLFSRRSGGSFLLRIDDTDQERSTAAFEDGIKADLHWLGLEFDETFRQSARFDEYHAAAQKLKDAGLLYPCYETAEELDRKRKLQRARGLPPVYDRAALELTEEEKATLKAEGRNPHWRFKLSRETVAWDDLIRGDVSVDTASVSDPVLIRGDGMFLYTLPSCVDDLDADITHVIRGEDHVTNTGVQIELFKALGGEPPRFAHHSLLVGADGEGLSKRFDSLSIEAMRDAGLEASTITSLLARLGTSDPVVPVRTLEVLAEGFDFDRVGRSPARFDLGELEALNAKILQETSYSEVKDRLGSEDFSDSFWNAIRTNITTLSDAKKWSSIVYGSIEPKVDDESLLRLAAELTPDEVIEESWGELTAALKEKTGKKGKHLFMPLRLALTGESSGPDMAVMFPLIGAEKAKARFLGKTA